MNSKKLYFLLIGMLGLLLSLVGLLFYFTNDQLNSISKSLIEKEIEIAIAEQDLHNIKELEKNLLEIKGLRSLMDEALPASKSQTEIVDEIQRIATANRVVFSAYEFEKTSGLPNEQSQTKGSGISDKVLSVPLTLVFSDQEYVSIKKLLGDLYSIRRNANVSEVDFTASSKRPGLVNGSIIVELNLEKPQTKEKAEKN